MKPNGAFVRLIRRSATVVALALFLTLNLAGSAGGQKNFEFELSAIRGAGIGELDSRIGRAGWGDRFTADGCCRERLSH